MSIKKYFLKNQPICRLTFNFPKEMAGGVSQVNLVGDFNGWDRTAGPMKRLKNGTYQKTLYLEKGNAYQFRYLLDDRNWENDPEADQYVPSPFFDAENSVVTT